MPLFSPSSSPQTHACGRAHLPSPSPSPEVDFASAGGTRRRLLKLSWLRSTAACRGGRPFAELAWSDDYTGALSAESSAAARLQNRAHQLRLETAAKRETETYPVDPWLAAAAESHASALGQPRPLRAVPRTRARCGQLQHTDALRSRSRPDP
ncbi:hypothetical protein OH77DRAFT_728699 [Trametes cingulata]|nr:hypothetical protein OH77DRAFT_728699 [Trametes cingulata]